MFILQKILNKLCQLVAGKISFSALPRKATPDELAKTICECFPVTCLPVSELKGPDQHSILETEITWHWVFVPGHVLRLPEHKEGRERRRGEQAGALYLP